MKRKLALLLCLVLCLGLLPPMTARAADDVAIDRTTFPDDAFRGYVSENIDTDKDGVLSSDEAANVYQLRVYKEGISTLKGVEYFFNLNTLECYDNQLTELDVSENKELVFLNCNNNALTELNVSGCRKLVTLRCDKNALTSLDVSSNTKLTSLNAQFNQLIALDVSGCTNLSNLALYSNQLMGLDVSKNTKLTWLGLDENRLSSLNVSKNTALKELHCSDNRLTELDVSKNTALTSLNCFGNQLTKLDVSKNTKLYWLTCDGNKLTKLDVRNNPKLRKAVREGERFLNQRTEDSGIAIGYLYKIDDENSYLLSYDEGVELLYKLAKPKITTQPKSISVKAGKKVTFKVKASGIELKYQWYYQKPGTSKWVKISKATSATYSFKAAKKQNGYKYHCVVRNAAGNVTSKAVKLTVK